MKRVWRHGTKVQVKYKQAKTTHIFWNLTIDTICIQSLRAAIFTTVVNGESRQHWTRWMTAIFKILRQKFATDVNKLRKHLCHCRYCRESQQRAEEDKMSELPVSCSSWFHARFYLGEHRPQILIAEGSSTLLRGWSWDEHEHLPDVLGGPDPALISTCFAPSLGRFP